MKNSFLVLFLLFSSIYAKDIYPTYKLKCFGFVSDFIVVKDKLYASNYSGTIDIFDLKTKKIIEQIVLNPITTARGRIIEPRIISVDHINGKTLFVSIGEGGYRNVWIYENHTLKQIIDESKKLTIKEARFIDDEKIMFGTFGSEVILHDTSENYHIYKSHISQSTLGDFTLNSTKTKMLTSHESGEIRILDVKTSEVEQILSSQNVDSVFHVAHSNGVTITAGQDRRVGVYKKGQKDYHIKSDFLVYCVGVSPSGKTGIYSSGEESNLQLFNTKTKQKTDILKGHVGVINQIKFINENELFTSERGYYILFWKI